LGKAIAIFLIILPTLVTGQVTPVFQELIATSSIKPTLKETEKLNDFIQTLQQKKGASEKKLLKSIFKATHQKFLKSYSQYADLGEVFKDGKFDCLTATSLLSVILSKMDFDYKIIETNYHIFILVNTASGQVMLETTDRLFGFIEDPAEIDKRIGSYRQNKIATFSNDKTYYHYSFDLFNEVHPSQLTGLLYFNQAIKAYNHGNLLACATLLEKSKRIYESPRVEELAIVLVKSVFESDLSADVKNQIIHQFKNLILSKGSPVASR
jgi:hypothetical protein